VFYVQVQSTSCAVIAVSVVVVFQISKLPFQNYAVTVEGFWMIAVSPASDAIGATLRASETHSIELDAGSKVLSTSDGLGWKNIHASVTSERRWQGSLVPIDHICFAYCLRQSARIERRIAGETKISALTLRPRQFGILPTRVASSFRLTGTADIMMIYLRGSLVERTAEQIYSLRAGQLDMSPKVGFCDPLLEQVSMEIAAALDRQDAEIDRPYIDELAKAAASQLLRHHTTRRDADTSARSIARTADGTALARVRVYIEDNLSGDLSLPILAQVAGLSTAGFAQAFAAAQGETPHQYVIRRRIERAKRLLMSTDASIVEIAFQAGFSSQSHLSDTFRRLNGVTPGAYRDAADNNRLAD
jgi:AraC family transcriptional regulator